SAAKADPCGDPGADWSLGALGPFRPRSAVPPRPARAQPPRPSLAALDPPHHEERRAKERGARREGCRDRRPVLQQTDVRDQAVQAVEQDPEHDAEEYLEAYGACAPGGV